MKLSLSLLKFFGFKELVRIPGKNFHNLSKGDVASMIDDHLGIGMGLFHPDALYEFVEIPNENEQLESTRRELVRIDELCSCPKERDGLGSLSGRNALKEFAARLRGASVSDLDGDGQ